MDEARAICDKLEALRAYARQAKNKELEIDAAEIHVRSEGRPRFQSNDRGRSVPSRPLKLANEHFPNLGRAGALCAPAPQESDLSSSRE